VQHKLLKIDTSRCSTTDLLNTQALVQHNRSFRQTSTGAAKALVHRHVQVQYKMLLAIHRPGTTGFCGKDTSRGSTACYRTNNRLLHGSTDFRTGAAKAVVELTSPCLGIAQKAVEQTRSGQQSSKKKRLIKRRNEEPFDLP
jgi:hypothetical protein